MKAAATNSWVEANQRHLLSALARVRAALERHIEQAQGSVGVPPAPAGIPAAELPAEVSAPTGAANPAGRRDAGAALPALETLCAMFRLSAFERDLLLLCAGMELDSRFPALCAAAQGDIQRNYPTFSLALAALPEAHWSALSPAAPLRHWRLIEIGTGPTLTLSPLRMDERVLHFLAGVPHLDERLAGFLMPVQENSELVESHRAVVEQMAAAWSRADAGGRFPVLQICGGETTGKRGIAASASAALGLRLNAMPVHSIPTTPAEIELLARLCEREAMLGASALLLDCEDLESHDPPRAAAARQFIERLGAALIVTARERRELFCRQAIAFEVRRPTATEQRRLWAQALGGTTTGLNGQVDRLVSQFDLGAADIQAAGGAWRAEQGADSRPEQPVDAAAAARLWDACRTQARQGLDQLAQRLDPVAQWDDLVLPPAQRQTLRDIATHVRQRARVHEDWGFATQGARGLGISALFAGASGTGKTMAAEVLANELRLDLYRIDLSQVVSKYIGETEKNLRRVFEAAEAGAAILLFDEADALFGKRSEVKDSHDRYANIEISYLLQRMEAYRGLAILTTNMKDALDPAFLRRLRFVVRFPFPDAAQRAEIWRRIFPSQTPTDGLDATRLARLNVTGGHIRNIALAAAFQAADAGEPVRMGHLLRAARTEYAKLEKPLTEAETKDWP